MISVRFKFSTQPIKFGLFNHWAIEKIIEDVKQYLDQQNVVSEIVGRIIVSERYKEKILSIIPKYYRRSKDLDLLTRSTTILYDDQKQPAEKIIWHQK